MAKQETVQCNLDQWIRDHHTEKAMEKAFLYMDVALKFIHDHGYCVEIFHPSRILVIDDDCTKILFVNLMELPTDYSGQSTCIKEDLYRSAFIQIGYYTNTFEYLKPEFLNDNFDEIAKFIPADYVPYYRGIIQRGNSIYLAEFCAAKAVRDLEALQQQLGAVDGNDKPSSDTFNKEPTPITNDGVNSQIYKQISGFREAAFASYLLIPTVALISLVLLAIIGWIISLF